MRHIAGRQSAIPGRFAEKRRKRKGRFLLGLRPILNFLRGHYRGVTWAQFRLCQRHGLNPNRTLDYDFDRFRPEDFVPDTITPGGFDPGTAAWCDDKVVFSLFMHKVGGNSPEVVAEHAGGRLILHGDAPDFAALLAHHGELVIKPRDGKSGRGVRLVRPGDPHPEPRPDEFATPRVHQHSYSASIFPGSANTIRVLTAFDYERDDVFVAAAAHRFGSVRGGIVDNWSAGGLGAGIDMETGRLGSGIRMARFDRARTRWSHHPDTGAQIEGVAIPRFSELCEDLLRIARRFPRRYVGWDIIMTQDSWVFLEANRLPDVSIFQTYRPLLLDRRMRTFFEREGVL